MTAGATRPFALLLEYDGAAYHGLQRQSHTEATIQTRLEMACAKLGGGETDFAAAGRTDTGVHATGMVVRVRLAETLEPEKATLALNAHLPADIRVRAAVPVSAEFHPRFDAIGRSYVYRLLSRESMPPLQRGFVARTVYTLDEDLMREAAACFAGRFEFREWRSTACQGTRTALTVDLAEAVAPEPDVPEPRPWWLLRFRARSFLHHQVRFMVGGVVAVASGRLPIGELRDALAAGCRPGIVKCEAAHGLCFTRAYYPAEKDPFPGAPS